MTDKGGVRAIIKAARAARSVEDRDRSREAIRTLILSWCAGAGLAPGSRIAAYIPMRTEPGSAQLLLDLAAAGYQVIVPVTLPDRDLDWVVWAAEVGAAANPPEDRLLGRDAIATAVLVLVPAFAVDRAGNRLGRGGGSYDRALSRAAAGTPIAAVIYQDELLPEVPTDPWDRPVSAAVSAEGWIELTPS